MGRIVALEPETTGSGRRVRIHAHGEPDTADKWFPCDAPNLIPLVVLQSPQTAVGTFPARGDLVQLLVMDRTLFDRIQHQNDDGEATLNGRVLNVLPARDASVVLVQYPLRAGAFGGQELRLQISNGYVRDALCGDCNLHIDTECYVFQLRVVSESVFLDNERRLAASIKSSDADGIDNKNASDVIGIDKSS